MTQENFWRMFVPWMGTEKGDLALAVVDLLVRHEDFDFGGAFLKQHGFVHYVVSS